MERLIGVSKYTYIHNANTPGELEYITPDDDLAFINKPVNPRRGAEESFRGGSMGLYGEGEIFIPRDWLSSAAVNKTIRIKVDP